MSGLITIELKQMRFFGYHGLHPEEKKKGNEFEVNLTVSITPKTNSIQNLSDTIDYERLFTLIREEMQKPRELLETLVMEICARLHNMFPSINRVDLTITKLHLPIEGFTGVADVNYSKDY